MKDHSNFLLSIQAYVKEYPEVAGNISDFVVKGISEARREDMERAADMEAALLFSVTKNMKDKDSFILGKLNKWKDKSVCNWTSTIEMLERKSNKEKFE
jgi:hypothetical protein